jgi:hypothetical protein
MTHLINLRLQPGRVILASLNFGLKIVVTFGIWRAHGRERPNGGCSRAQASDKQGSPRCPGGADGSAGYSGQHFIKQLQQGNKWVPLRRLDKRAWISGGRAIFWFDASSSCGDSSPMESEPQEAPEAHNNTQVKRQAASCFVAQGCILAVDRRIFSPIDLVTCE